jgi:hypothetical protein
VVLKLIYINEKEGRKDRKDFSVLDVEGRNEYKNSKSKTNLS